MKRLLLLCTLLTFAPVGCATAPPNLGPVAIRDFHKTRVIKGLDLLRDFAIDAEAQTPKVLPTATTRTIVQYHESALKIIASTDTGWVSAVKTSLNEAVGRLPESDRPKVAPYVTLVITILDEVTR